MKPMAKDERPPILLNKHHRDASVFHPENLFKISRHAAGEINKHGVTEISRPLQSIAVLYGHSDSFIVNGPNFKPG